MMPLSKLDLDGLEERLDAKTNCLDPLAEVTVFGEHVAENFRCSYEVNLSGQLDGKDVPTIPAEGFAAGAEQLRADLKLIGTTHVSSAAVGWSGSEVWTACTQPNRRYRAVMAKSVRC